MTTVTELNNLQELTNLLQQCLNAKMPELIPSQVRCVFKNGVLMILIEHPAEVLLAPQLTCSIVEQAIANLHPESSLPVNLYLRVLRSQQPYSYHKFTVEPSIELPVTPVSDREIDDPIDEIEIIWEALLNAEPSIETDNNQENREDIHTQTDQTAPPFVLEETSSETFDFASAPSLNLEEEIIENERGTDINFAKFRVSLPIFIVGAGVGIGVFFLTFYALTRPCIIGSCRELQTAQQLSDQSAQIIEQPQSGQEILQAQQQLQTSIRLLKSIPWWSSQHKEAQQLLGGVEMQAARLNEAMIGLQKANLASQKGQNPPHPESAWREMQQLWQDAIADLQQIPDDTNAYALAQLKIEEYQNNLAVVNDKLTVEQRAIESLSAAKEAAQVAIALQGVAQSLENWQRVNVYWEQAITELDQIPQETTAYAEAQNLLKAYQPQQSVARDRTVREQFATNAYNEGLRLAQEARNSQADNQWSQAVSNWRNALSYIKQVPQGSFYYAKAQNITNSYNNSLKQAQTRLQLALLREKAGQDLEETCSGTPQICNYVFANDTIQVRLTPNYAQKVRQTALTARAKGDYKAQIGVVNHVITFGEALEAISDNARLPLEVYGPDGALIERHTP